jgi:hypothetical protein
MALSTTSSTVGAAAAAVEKTRPAAIQRINIFSFLSFGRGGRWG